MTRGLPTSAWACAGEGGDPDPPNSPPEGSSRPCCQLPVLSSKCPCPRDLFAQLQRYERIATKSRHLTLGAFREANPRGFCAGVNMAIECLERALDFFGPPLYVYHEIVHNKFVVDRFRRRGTVFVESLDEVPEGSPLLYSAHGVSPQIREKARE